MKFRFLPKFFGLPLFLFIFVFNFQNVFSQNNPVENRKISLSRNGGDETIAVPVRPRIYTSAAEENAETSVSNSAGNAFELARRVFDLINLERLKASLPPLTWNDDAARIARLHSANMANLHFFSHTGLDGKMVNNRADDVGMTKWRQIGENIAYNRGFKSPLESAVQSWMNSAGHRENILKADWRESGVGVVALENGTYYFTQVFLLKN